MEYSEMRMRTEDVEGVIMCQCGVCVGGWWGVGIFFFSNNQDENVVFSVSTSKSVWFQAEDCTKLFVNLL